MTKFGIKREKHVAVGDRNRYDLYCGIMILPSSLRHRKEGGLPSWGETQVYDSNQPLEVQGIPLNKPSFMFDENYSKKPIKCIVKFGDMLYK